MHDVLVHDIAAVFRAAGEGNLRQTGKLFTDLAVLLDQGVVVGDDALELLCAQRALRFADAEVLRPAVVKEAVDAAHGRGPVARAVRRIRAAAVVPDAGRGSCVRVVCADEHAAFTQRRHGLCRMEAEAAEIAERADVLAVNAAVERLRAVLHDLQTVCPCDGDDAFHVARHAEQMYADHGLRFGCDLARNIVRVNGPGVRVDIGPDDLCTQIAEGNRGGAEGISGDDDLVAGLDMAEDCGHFQRACAVVDGKGVLRAGKGAEGLLKLDHVFALRLAAGLTHDLDDCVDLCFCIGMLHGGAGHAEAVNGAAAGCITEHSFVGHGTLPPECGKIVDKKFG